MNEQGTLALLSGLDEQALYSVQIASLLGDAFSLDHLLELGNMRPTSLLTLLDELIKRGVIKEKPGSNRGTYCFLSKRQPKIILQSMEEGKRRSCLSNTIDYLERNLPNDDNKPLILAELYMKFKNNRDNLQYTKKAADLLKSAHKTEEALRLYEGVINDLLAKNRDPLESMVLIESVIAYAPIAINLHSPESIFPMIDKARSLANDLHNDRAKALLELCLGRIAQCRGDSLKASVHYDQGWHMAQSAGDEELLRKASKLFALSMFWHGRVKEAIEIYERTLGNVEEISPELEDVWAYLMLAYCYGIRGRVARGVGLAEAVRERAVSKGYLKTQAFSHAVIALIFIEVAQVDNARPHFNKALDIGEKIGSDLAIWIANACKAYDIYSKGDLKRARGLLESALSRGKALGQRHNPCPWHLEIFWSLHKADFEPVEDFPFISEIDRLRNWPDIYMKGAALRYHALSRKISGADSKEIEGLLLESEKLLRESGALVELARTQVELARFSVEKKEMRRAKKVADMAYQTLSEIDRSLFPSELLFLIQKDSKQSRLFDGISELTTALRSLPDYSTYLGKVVAILTDMFGAERAAILIKQNDGQNDLLRIAATRNFSPEELQHFDQGHLRDLISMTLAKNEPLIVADTKKSSSLVQRIAGNFPIKSLACIPLAIDGEPLGLIYTDNRLLRGIFSKKDLVIMTSIAAQVSLSLKNVSLSKKLQGLKNNYQRDTFFVERIESHEDFPQIIGKSKAITEVLTKARKVSETSATVLILGETGVGKELIARSIHQLSDRADKPFVVVNVSALSETLLPTELFGYEKGAFTGAERSKVGRFEMADKGTIFLDEIGDLSMEAQVKLLRVLQEGEFERVGGTRTIHSNFRLIAATNRNLRDLVARGGFRSDLFYRISTFPIHIPPLRERNGDLKSLSLHFAQEYATKHGKKVKKIPSSEMKKLAEYPWPGNVRELEHVIERALILSENETLLIPNFEMPHCITESPHCAIYEEAGTQTDFFSLDEIQRRHITSVLSHVKWRIRGKRGAAEILGLKPSTLEFRMKKLGINR